MKFSNPRLHAEFNDWPLGGNRRGKCVFRVETHPKKGQRIARTTTGAPKHTTYAHQARIVDGDDGRTYLLMWSTQYGSAISIKQSDCQFDAKFDDLPNYIPVDHPRYKEVIELFTSTLQPEVKRPKIVEDCEDRSHPEACGCGRQDRDGEGQPVQ